MGEYCKILVDTETGTYFSVTAMNDMRIVDIRQEMVDDMSDSELAEYALENGVSLGEYYG